MSARVPRTASPAPRQDRPAARRIPFDLRREGARIFPEAGTASRPLVGVIAVMCFLACLALGILIIINRSVDMWTADVASQVTIQVKPVDGVDTEATVEKALEILKASKGVVSATALSKSDNARLLEPWLGPGASIDDLPVPRLITVAIDKSDPPDYAAIAAALETAAPGATLDSHQHWQRQILRTSGTLKLLGYAVLLLVSATTVAIVIFATRAAMASNRDTVEVLHMIGAQDDFIALEVQRHFLKLGLKAGLVGVAAGVASFVTVKALSGGPSSGDGVGAQMLVGTATIGVLDYFLFLFVPIGAALISVVTARLAVLRILGHVL